MCNHQQRHLHQHHVRAASAKHSQCAARACGVVRRRRSRAATGGKDELDAWADADDYAGRRRAAGCRDADHAARRDVSAAAAAATGLEAQLQQLASHQRENERLQQRG